MIEGQVTPRAHSKRRGTALVISLVAVMVIAGLGAGLVQMQAAITAKHDFSIDRRRALYVAEAGIAEAALAVSQGKSGIIADEDVPATFGGGLFWVETADLPDSRIALICTTRVGCAEFVLRTIVVPNLNPVASLGFFGAESVELGWGTVADGYHSGRGSFASQSRTNGDGIVTTGRSLALGSNGDVLLDESVLEAPMDEPERTTSSEAADTTTVLESEREPVDGTTWETLVASEAESTLAVEGPVVSHETGLGGPPPGDPTRLFGTLKPGPEGYVRSNGFSEVRGSIVPARYPEDLPEITFPTPLETIAGDVIVTGTAAGVGTRVETEVNGDVRVTSGATLTLSGPCVLVANRLVVEDGATLHFDDTSGPIFIYLSDLCDLRPGSSVESLSDHEVARGTSIFLAHAGLPTNRVRVECSGTFHGILYAPGDVIEIPASLRYFGSAVARVLRTERGARLSYDRRLAIGGEGVATLPRILSWQIVPVGDGTARRLRVDPMVEVSMRGVTPIAPAEAAPETNARVQYIDMAGDEQTHLGPFAALSTSQVRRILGLRWDDPRDGVPRGWLRPAGDDPSGAVENDRRSDRAVREGIQTVSGGEDVSSLTDTEILDLLTLLPTELLNALPPLAVQTRQRVLGSVTDEALTSTFDLDDWWDSSTNKEQREESDATAGGAILLPQEDAALDV